MKRASAKILILILPVMLLMSSFCSIGCMAGQVMTAVPDDAVQLGGHYYKIYDDLAGFKKATADKAEKFCEKRGGHLAVITSEEEDELLHDLCVDKGYSNVFFGLAMTDGKWKWANGEKSSYTNWASDKQGGKSGSVAQYSDDFEDGSWKSGTFGKEGTAYICEWDSGTKVSDFSSEKGEEWVDNGKSKRLGKSYYMVFDIHLERGEASKLCKSMGGHLACINNKDEQKFVNDLIDKNGSSNMYWIGALLAKDGWTWENGDSMERFHDWTTKKPNNKDNDAYFAAINKSLDKYDKGRWVAQTYSGSQSSEAENCINFGFVCEWETVCVSEAGEFVTHSGGEWQVLSESSCVNSGRRVKYCERCGGIAKDEEIPAEGHEFAEKKLLVPGYTELVCVKCSERSRKINSHRIWILPVLVIIYLLVVAAYMTARSDFERYARSKGIEIQTKRVKWWVFAIPPAAYLLLLGIMYIATG